MSKSKNQKTELIATYVILTILALFIIVPILWMVSTAFKTEAQTYYPNPRWIPDPFSVESFRNFSALTILAR